MPPGQGELAGLRDALVAFGERRDWRRFPGPRALAVSVAIEAAELLELTQWKSDAAFAAWAAEHREIVAAECADVLSYLVLLADAVGFDLADAVRAKIAVNEARFPVPSGDAGDGSRAPGDAPVRRLQGGEKPGS